MVNVQYPRCKNKKKSQCFLSSGKNTLKQCSSTDGMTHFKESSNDHSFCEVAERTCENLIELQTGLSLTRTAGKRMQLDFNDIHFNFDFDSNSSLQFRFTINKQFGSSAERGDHRSFDECFMTACNKLAEQKWRDLKFEFSEKFKGT